MVSYSELFAEFRGNPPASHAVITRYQADLRFRLPSDYVKFLQRMNGGQGFVGQNYLMAWRIDELVRTNRNYLVEEAAPELFLFGSDGGGEAFAFDTRSTPPVVVMVPFIGMELSTAIPIGRSFDEFLQNLYGSDSLFDCRLPPYSS